MRRCFIAGAGEYCGLFTPGADDYIIAADGGYDALISHGITPDVIIGDFDSIAETPALSNVITAPAEKDDTDMLLAVKYGLSHGCDVFIIDGALGGRFDHSFANLQVLNYIAGQSARGYLIGRDMCVTVLRDGEIRFAAEASGYISVFSAGDRAEDVTISGLKYTVDNAALTNDFPIGVSNEFIGEFVSITVRNGAIAVMWQCGIEFLAEIK